MKAGKGIMGEDFKWGDVWEGMEEEDIEER